MYENLCNSCFLKSGNSCYCTGKPEVMRPGVVTRCDYHYFSDYSNDIVAKSLFIRGFCWATENHNHVLEEYKKLKNSKVITYQSMMRLQNILDALGDLIDDLQKEDKEDEEDEHSNQDTV